MSGMTLLRNTVGRFQAELAVLAIIAGIVIVFSANGTNLLTTAALTNVFARSVTVGLLVVGLTLCLLVGEIDLSIGATMALGGVVFAALQPTHGMLVAVLVALAVGLAVGLLNSLLICVLGVNSFIATLGSLFVAQSLALVLSGGEPIAPTAYDASSRLAELLFGPVSVAFLLLVGCVLAGHVLVTRTRVGREMLAVGGNTDAARSAGIPVIRRRAFAFALSGILSSLAGIQLALSLLSAAPATGDVELLTTVAAVFLAGVALTGGRGSILAAALAVLALSALSAGLEVAQVEPAYGRIILGAVVVVSGSLVGRSDLVRVLRLVRANRMKSASAA
jgi:ribose/xylose/arabinose/galactoside ABC-type transport system permease subunit